MHDIIVRFNNHNFDDKLCAANGIIIPEEKSYDILKHIWIGADLEQNTNITSIEVIV